MAKRLRKRQARSVESKPAPPAATIDGSDKSSSILMRLPWKVLLVALVPFIIAAIPFSMGKYIELNTPGPFDSSAYVYSAYKILNGARIGIDEKPSAQYGTLFMNMVGVALFGFNDVGPKMVQMVLQIVALVFLYWAMRSHFGAVPAGIGLIIAATFLSAPVISKFGNVKEQFMIAFVVIGISCLILYLKKGRWYWAILAGAFLSWGPLFKETGISALLACGLFLLSQPLLRFQSLKWTGKAFVLGLLGFILALAPVFAWCKYQGPPAGYPYRSLILFIVPALQSVQPDSKDGSVTKKRSSSASDEQKSIDDAKADSPPKPVKSQRYWQAGRNEKTLKVQRERVLRYYRTLWLPISLAVLSILVGLVRWGATLGKPAKDEPANHLALLLTIWWILDMAFVWISVRSYEQYYLPLCTSAAMLGGYWLYVLFRSLAFFRSVLSRAVTGAALLMVGYMGSSYIFTGLTSSPDTGNTYPEPRRGFKQSLESVKVRRSHDGPTSDWQAIGRYIREHSSPDDTIYVWGWFPGIYVEAQRLSDVPRASYSNMHVVPPESLRLYLFEVVSRIYRDPPLYIVDSKKVHFPNDRPPLLLWPRMRPDGTGDFWPADNPRLISALSRQHQQVLSNAFGEDEGERFKRMQWLRSFIRENYERVPMKNSRMELFRHKGTLTLTEKQRRILDANPLPD